MPFCQLTQNGQSHCDGRNGVPHPHQQAIALAVTIRTVILYLGPMGVQSLTLEDISAPGAELQEFQSI